MTDRDIRRNIAESRDIWLASLPDYDAQPSEFLPNTPIPIKEMVRRRHNKKLLPFFSDLNGSPIDTNTHHI